MHQDLSAIPGLRLIGTTAEKVGVLSFALDGVRFEDVGLVLDQHGIAVRVGRHCAHLTMRRFGVDATIRPSLALYNTPCRHRRGGEGHRQGKGRSLKRSQFSFSNPKK